MRRVAIRWTGVVVVLASFGPVAALAQTTAPLPLGQGRPETPGITRTTLQDDAKMTVTRVHFRPGAAEPEHTHATDVILVPVTPGTIELGIAGRKITSAKPGDAHFVPRNTTHSLSNSGKQDFELIAIALK
jgi:quercetin dioxygenase-like cupin family protein